MPSFQGSIAMRGHVYLQCRIASVSYACCKRSTPLKKWRTHLEGIIFWMYLFVKSPQGIRDLRHRVLVFLSAMFWQPIPACDFSRQKAVVFSSEGWPYLDVNLSTIDTRISKYYAIHIWIGDLTQFPFQEEMFASESERVS